MVYALDRSSSHLEQAESPYIGFGIAFPWSANAPTVNYRVNEIYWDLSMKQAFEDDIYE